MTAYGQYRAETLSAKMCYPAVPEYAALSAATSNFTIFIMASATRVAYVCSESAIISMRSPGMICHETPKRSFSHPHASGAPPPSSSAFQ